MDYCGISDGLIPCDRLRKGERVVFDHWLELGDGLLFNLNSVSHNLDSCVCISSPIARMHNQQNDNTDSNELDKFAIQEAEDSRTVVMAEGVLTVVVLVVTGRSLAIFALF